MKRFRRIALSLVLAVAMVVAFAGPTLAQNPTVTIYVSARVVSITNSMASWNITVVGLGGTAYFSADNNPNPTYSAITNTGNVNCDVEIQGTDFEGGAYDWTLSNDGTAGNQTYSLKANSEAASTTYDVVVKRTADYNDICTALVPDDTYDWSMLFTAPNEFHKDDAGAYKTATTTLVASAS